MNSLATTSGVRRGARSGFAFVLAFLAAAPATAQVRHPLDPLDWGEHWTVLEVLRDAGRLNDSTRFSLVRLHEPDKTMAWDWRPGQPFTRTAFAMVRQQARTYEAVIDVTGSRLVSWTEAPGAQPGFLDEEYGSVVGAVKEHPEFLAAMRRRGITDLTFIDCFTIPPGYFGIPEFEGRRIGHTYCEDVRRVRNTWVRQIEGLTVIVDMNTQEVLEVVDEGAVPIPTAVADYDEGSIGPLRKNATPIDMSQPLGPAFRRDGHAVEWDAWSFHVRPDPRVGMILSTVRFRDGDRTRPVLYEGSLSEIFVPYMDPSAQWYTRNFLDAGEFAVGGLAKPLERGLDCPDNADYLDLIVAGDNGRPRTVPRTICVFERYAGDVAWRHRAETVDARPKRDLVVRMTAVLGNYDYIFDWVFQQDGTIRVAVGATGIAEVKMVAQQKAVIAQNGGNGNGASGTGAGAAAADAYGRFVADNVVAVNHDHYMNFRLDLDVDGATNRFQRDRLETVTLPPESPRRSVWVVKPEVARTERDAMLNVDMHRPSLWRVVNPSVRNHVGYASSYQLNPGMTVETLLSQDDWPRRRAAFIDHHLWVTPYRADERYAAGLYPTLSKPGEGLLKWTSANRPIVDTDIVLWYTMGMHHVVRAEDWPVMPVAWFSFELRPFDFHDRNPSLTAPRTTR